MPTVVLERPKMSRALWESLKAYIMRERQRKKQEQEADAEVERQRRERERKQKQDVMTLEETKEQLTKLETHLATVKEEKHQLFLKLKKALNEDESRRRTQILKDEAAMGMVYGHPPNQLGAGSPQVFLQSMSLGPRPPLYKVGPQSHSSHTLLPRATLKRGRSPSPPPIVNFQGYNPYKPGALHPGYQQKPSLSSQYTTTQTGSYYIHQPPQTQGPTHGSSSEVTYVSAPQASPGMYTYATPSISSQYGQLGPQGSSRDDKHGVPQMYHGHGQPPNRAYLGLSSHQPLPDQKLSFGEAEKYYSPHAAMTSVRSGTHVGMHVGGIPIQQSPQGGKTGGITSGYPIRCPVPATTYPPTSVPGTTYPPTSVPTTVYVNPPTQRMSYNPPHPGHPSITGRYPPGDT